jgi:short-subunit dehydrogenase
MHVAVTGASSGIGEAIAREFARAGASLTVVARRTELLEKIAKECAPARVRVVSHDLAKPESAADWIAGAEAELGPIDVLVNNAGLENSGPTASSDVATGMRVLSLNMLTPILLTRAVLPGMIARARGTIVNVASLAAYSPMPRMA